MPRHIVKLTKEDNDFYLEWSTVVDAPVTNAMTLDEFKSYYLGRYGSVGYDSLQRRIDNANESGVSEHTKEESTSFFLYNRAGKGEATLSKEELVLMLIP